MMTDPLFEVKLEMGPQVLQSNTAGPSAPKGDMPATLLWWLSSLPVTLESLYYALATLPPDALAMALQAYLAQHPEQATELRGSWSRHSSATSRGGIACGR